MDYSSNDTLGQLQQAVEETETKRGMLVWHDHSDIVKKSYYVVNVQFIYDPAVYLTSSEAGWAIVLLAKLNRQEPHALL